jgi:hypothetical protein
VRSARVRDIVGAASVLLAAATFLASQVPMLRALLVHVIPP